MSCNKTVLLTGDSGVFTLAHRWITHLTAKGLKVHIVDCAIRLDVFALAEAALLAGIPADDLLEQITLVRAFTPYQILDACDSTPAGRLLVFLAPHKQFFDADVKTDEADFLLKQLYHKVLSSPRKILLVDKDSYDHPVFRCLFPQLCRNTNKIYLLRETLQGKKIQQLRGNQWDARYRHTHNKLPVLKKS